MIKKTILFLFPSHTKRGRWVKRQAIKSGLAKPYIYDANYQRWIEHTEPSLWIAPLENNKELPLLSIVAPIFNTKEKYLQPLLYSIRNQSYENWELILADASTNNERAKAIRLHAEDDARVKYFRLDINEGISGNTNQGLSHAKGKYVVFMDHDDTLALNALNEVAAVLVQDPTTDIIYSDEDKITDDGTLRHAPHFKPEWSPHQFLSCNWTNHMSVIRKELIEKVGGLRPEFDGSQDYDLLLRIHALPGRRNVKHIPKVLYHWRVAEGSTASNFNEKSYAVMAGVKALSNHLDQRKIAGKAQALPNLPGFYEAILTPNTGRKALVVVESDDSEPINEAFKKKLAAYNNSNVETKFVTAREYEKQANKLLDWLNVDDHIYKLTGRLFPISPAWLDRLSGALEMDDVYVVGPRILDTANNVFDMGLVRMGSGKLYSLFKGYPTHGDAAIGNAEWVRDVDGLSGRIFGTRKSNWKHCLEMQQEGLITAPANTNRYCVCWTPVNFLHASDKPATTAGFNPNLSVEHEQVRQI